MLFFELLKKFSLSLRRKFNGIFMKKLVFVVLALAQAGVALAQNCCAADTVVQELRYPLTQKDTETVFWYLNNEWISGADPGMVPVDSIAEMKVKDDRYGNRAIFITVSPETLSAVKAKAQASARTMCTEPYCEFPGGNGRLKEWVNANIRIPEGYRGNERVVVEFLVHPDGSVSDGKVIESSTDEAANAEALRLVAALPRFMVKYYTPEKKPLKMLWPIFFREPGTIIIRGDKSDFTAQFPDIEKKIRNLYENGVFRTSASEQSGMWDDICTVGFLRRLWEENDADGGGFATWLLRSGMQDGDDSPSQVLSVVPGADNTVVVRWSDMGHKGSTTFTMTKVDGTWKIADATVPLGFPPL